MKVKCVKNTYIKGFMIKEKKKVNLTIGKVYEASPILNSDWRDDMRKEHHEFLVFNDAGRWSSYPMEMFTDGAQYDY